VPLRNLGSFSTEHLRYIFAEAELAQEPQIVLADSADLTDLVRAASHPPWRISRLLVGDMPTGLW
jgi:hypothetical protein